MNTQAEPTTATASWSVDEWRALQALKTRYQQGGVLFTATEQARLEFLRWLYRTDRLVP